MTDVLTVVVGVLAADDVPRDSGPDFGKASPVGLVVVVILMICTFALVWSMNRHLKQLPESFDPQHPEPDQEFDEGTVGSAEEQAETRDSKREPGG